MNNSEETSQKRWLMRSVSGDLVYHEGSRAIDLETDVLHPSKDVYEYVLYAKSLRYWRHPHTGDPLNHAIREDILRNVTCLLQSTDSRIRTRFVW